MKLLLVVCIVLIGAVAAREYDRACRTAFMSPRVKTGFQLLSYSGTWFEISRYQQTPWPLNCATARYNALADGSLSVSNSGFAPNGTFVDVTGRATLSFPAQSPLPAKLDVVFPTDQLSSIYWILSTDYFGYSVVWSCLDLPAGRSREQVWVLSRQTELTVAQAIRINQILAENDLALESIEVTDHELPICG